MIQVRWMLPGILLSIAVLSLILRLLLPQIDFYKQNVATTLTELTGQAVRINQISGSLGAYAPVVTISNIAFGNKADPDSMQFSEIGVEFNLWQSLWQRQISIRSVRLSGGKIGIVRTQTGDFKVHPIVAALSGQGQEGGTGDRAIEVIVSNVDFNFYDEQSQRGELAHIERLVFESDRGVHQLAGELVLPDALGRRIEFSTRLEGDLLKAGTWSGQFYFAAEQLRVQEFFKLLGISGNYQAQVNVTLRGEFSDFSNGRISGDFECLDCSIEAGPSFDFSSMMYVNNNPSGWRLEITDAEFVSEQGRFEDIAVALRKQTGQAFLDAVLLMPHFSGDMLDKLKQFPQVADRMQGVDFNLASGSLELSGRIPVEQDLLLDENLPSRLLQQSPQQLLLAQLVRARLKLKGAVIVRGKQKQGFDSVEMSLRSIRSSQGLVVALDQLELTDGKAAFDARLAWYDKTGQTPQLKISSHLRNVQIDTVFSWLPYSIQTNDMLNQARWFVPAGKIQQGTIEWFGALSEEAFRSGDYVLRADVALRKLKIHYDTTQKFPDRILQDIDMTLGVNQQKVQLDVSSIRYRKYLFQDMRLGVEDITKPYLNMRASGSGPLQDLMRLLQQSEVLDQDSMAALDDIDIAADTQFDVNLGVAMDKEVRQATRLDGTFNVHEGMVHLKALDMRFDQIKSSVRFNAKEMTAQTLQGRLNQQYPLSGRLESSKGKASLLVSGDVPAEFLAQRFFPQWKQSVSGSNALQVRLEWPWFQEAPESDEGLSLQVISNLKGTAIALPNPLRKSADESKALALNVQWLDKGERYRLRYDGTVDANIVRLNDQIKQVRIHFGTGPRPQKRAAFSLTGRISETFFLDQWQALLAKGESEEDAGTDNTLMPLQLALQFDDLRYGKNNLNAVAVNAKIDSSRHWQVDIDSELLKGKISGQTQKDKLLLKARMDSIVLPDGKVFQTSGGGSSLRPEDIPVLDITAKRIHYGDFSCKDLKLRSTHKKNTWVLSEFSCNESNVRLSMRGEWFANKKAESTQVEFETNGEDYGKILKNWKLSNDLDGGRGQIVGNLRWRDGITAFDLVRSVGRVRFDLTDAGIPISKSGFARLFGLLNFGNIMRSLSTDFGNVFRNNIGVSRLKGSIAFKGRDAHVNQLILRNPALSVTMSGRIGLAARDYDQTMEVVPNLSSSLFLGGSILGGPIGGGAVVLLNKLTNLSQHINDRYTLNYRITGSWDKPEIKLIGHRVSKQERQEEDQRGEKEESNKKKELLGTPLDWINKQLKKGKSIILPEKK